MAKTMEQYMSKTRSDYGSGVSRPKIEENDNFKLKGKILDSRGAIPLMIDVDAKVAIQEMAKYSQKWHNETSRTRSTETSDDVNNVKFPTTPCISHSKKKGNPRRSLLHSIWCTFSRRGYRATTMGFYQRNNGNPSYQEQRKSIEDTLSKFMGESEKRHEENSNLIKETRASTDAAIRNQGASIKTLEIQIGQMSKVLQERGFGSLSSSTKTNLRDHVKSISTIVEADGSYGPQFLKAYSYEASHINKSISFNNALADLGASISVMPLLTYLDLGLGELAHTKLTVELADRIVKYQKRIAKNVLVELRRDQVDDLMATVKEGEIIEEFRARNDARMV
nr:hypothetical protein [Tanacetum cinerariifolium]